MTDLLTVRKLTKSFGGLAAVHNCSFHVGKGMITALIGPNGSGKSTVFNLISGILLADTGSIKLGRYELLGLQPHVIAQKGVARVFQQTRLINNLTVEENLVLAADKENTSLIQNVIKQKKDFSKDVKTTLKKVSLSDLKDRRVDALSYGQRRLVELARCIMMADDLLLLDEPVAGVTPASRNKIQKILQNLKKENHTILLIEHDMQFVLSIADHIIVMDEGRVIAKGTPTQIKKNKAVLEAYLGE